MIEVIDKSGFSPSELEEKTGIKRFTWGNLKTGKQRANEEHIEALVKLWPEYAYWITTGMTLPEAGQISPEMEETRKKLDQVG
ncbi:MAG: DNA-binding protein [Methylobacter sp.]|uniref:DNA-binding protein n=1 Tax=Methylobacter sp. TaxID=2051955 RepID=UPI00258812F7|nr:DNA-binding protein [Methylobacter sp.]MCL7422868.1 DNA-binding protein [Methylobacter sp.]